MSEIWKKKVVTKTFCAYCNQTYSKKSIHRHVQSNKHAVCYEKNKAEGARLSLPLSIYKSHDFFGDFPGFPPCIIWVKCPRCYNENEHGLGPPPALDYLDTRVCDRCGLDYRLPLKHLIDDD